MDSEYVSGLDDLDRVLEEFGQRAVEEAANLLYARGETIMLDSKDRYVPVDQSTLQGTGHVELPVIDGTNISVRLAYGGPAAPYAEAIHEHLSAMSPRSWKKAEAEGRPVHFTQGGPKYLERPYLEGIRDLAEWIADGIRARCGT